MKNILGIFFEQRTLLTIPGFTIWHKASITKTESILWDLEQNFSAEELSMLHDIDPLSNFCVKCETYGDVKYIYFTLNKSY